MSFRVKRSREEREMTYEDGRESAKDLSSKVPDKFPLPSNAIPTDSNSNKSSYLPPTTLIHISSHLLKLSRESEWETHVQFQSHLCFVPPASPVSPPPSTSDSTSLLGVKIGSKYRTRRWALVVQKTSLVKGVERVQHPIATIFDFERG